MGKASPEETQTSNIVKCIGQIGGFRTGGEAMTLWGTHSEHSSLVRSNDSEMYRGGNKMPDGISLQPLNNAFLVSVCNPGHSRHHRDRKFLSEAHSEGW